jgi:cation-transporting P-type ATPase E
MAKRDMLRLRARACADSPSDGSLSVSALSRGQAPGHGRKGHAEVRRPRSAVRRVVLSGREGDDERGRLTAVTIEAPPVRPDGLSEEEAARRLAERGPIEPPPSSRSYASIVRANVLTVFNAILAAAGIVTLAFGAWQDALFLGILLANTGIGIVQEVRAKRALDQLAALVEPMAVVVRDGVSRVAHAEELVVGDLVRVEPGNQLVADGTVATSAGLALDESNLSGESRPVVRGPGDEVRSGSFVLEGSGTYTVTAVGPDSYAERVARIARAFRHPRSPLEHSLNLLLLVLAGVIVPLGAILGYALWERDTPFSEAVPTSVAAVVTLVPEGLILLTSLTFAVAALRMTRRGVLAQQLNAIESLAAVDIVCFDKTGTLTEARVRVAGLVPALGVEEDELRAALGRYAASAGSRNGTLEAIGEACPGLGEAPVQEVAFASRRRWSGVRLGGTTFVLGAPELFPLGPLAARADAEARAGRRVLAIGRSEAELDDPDTGPPSPLRPIGLVLLAERLRADARETVAFFRAQGVELKVLSGDRPETVAAIARDAGIEVETPADGRELSDGAVDAAVIGRISPEGKQLVVEALAARGRYVAMVGDGVNDVPALKAARLAIAQGSGAQMAKSVADLVLVRGEFGAVPALVAEGRKVFRNIQRVAKLFVTKSAFAAFLILSIGLTPTAYPLLPRHLSLAAALAIGIPAFFLALAPSIDGREDRGFGTGVVRFAIPAGTAAGIGVLSSYVFTLNVIDRPLLEARTVATTVLIAVGLYLILALEASGRLRAAAVSTLVAGLAVIYALLLATGPLRRFFDLAVPDPAMIAVSAFGSALAIGLLVATDDRFVPWWPARF